MKIKQNTPHNGWLFFLHHIQFPKYNASWIKFFISVNKFHFLLDAILLNQNCPCQFFCFIKQILVQNLSPRFHISHVETTDRTTVFSLVKRLTGESGIKE